ncbi:MAG: zinc ribbon domain-containing protein [Candidatus Heimdallarchaeota archaeon]
MADLEAERKTPKYKAELAESTAIAHEKQVKKQRTKAIVALVMGILFLGTSFIALETAAFIFMLAAGILFIAFGGFVFYISGQTKKAAERQRQAKAQYEAEMAGQPQQPVQPTQPQQPQAQIISAKPQPVQQQAQPKTTAKFCISCGQKITPGVKFCNKCGAEL